MTDRMTFTATGGQTARPTDFGCTPLETALKDKLKSIIIKNRMCIWTGPYSLNVQKAKYQTTIFLTSRQSLYCHEEGSL